MILYSTCARCHKLLDCVLPGLRVHPMCEEISAPADILAKQYRQALAADDEVEIERLGAMLDEQPPPRLLDAALVYAVRFGWPVFPVAPGEKVPLTRNGFKDATTDPAQIRAWWQATPAANIGLPTGIAFDVLDVDPPQGWDGYWQMRNADAIPEVHAMAVTPRGGLHLYLLPSGSGNRAGMLPGIDYRGAGGYVLAPPSVTTTGSYAFRSHPSPVITGHKTKEQAA